MRARVEPMRGELRAMAGGLDPRIQRWYERLSLARAIVTIIGLAIVLVLVAGLLERLVEPETFSSIGLAYWWAVTTVTTVGYGDVLPETTGGRIVAALLMLTGLGLIPLITSVVVSILVSQRTREARAEEMADLRLILDRLDAIDGRL